MSKRFAQVIILIEDKQQRSFVSRFLRELGYPVHKLKILPIPAGVGSGEAYIREQYPIQVKALRTRAKSQDVAFIVAIDADVRTIADRQKQLADELIAAGLPPRTVDEKIVHLIPRRNIETWIGDLADITKTIDETVEYPKLTGREREGQKAVEALASLLRSSQPLPATLPPSLEAAIEELKRLSFGRSSE